MSKADEIFDKLGYEVDSSCELDGRLYYYKNDLRIDFDLSRKSFYKYSCVNSCRCSISMQELDAINEKVKELGWNE